MRKFIIGILSFIFLFALVVSVSANGNATPKATGDIWMSGPSQQMDFNAFDYGNPSEDKGTVEYWNYDYPGLLHYTANVLCARVEDNSARFMFQIPNGWPGLTGLYVVVSIQDNGTPGTSGDLYGHAATGNLTQAMSWCENGVSVTNYQITAGNLVVHN